MQNMARIIITIMDYNAIIMVTCHIKFDSKV